jgi:hypothetical protein
MVVSGGRNPEGKGNNLVILVLPVPIQPLAAVTTTEYNPVLFTLIVFEILPSFHR